MVVGLETASAGRIVIGERDVTHLPPNKRDVGMVFQSYALFPNMTVRGNIAFGLKLAKSPVSEVTSRVDATLAIIKLPQLADRFRHQLSGGKQQRVALRAGPGAKGSTNRGRRSTPRSASPCATRSARCSANSALRRSLSRTTRRKICRCPIASS
jgi:putative spermidine/putrescine transport system ATP-binding protein